MKTLLKILFYFSLLASPFLLVVVVNESQRRKTIGHKPNDLYKINSAEKTPDYCTWHCHNDTNYCIREHNKIIKGNFLTFTNRIYFNIIGFLASIKGAYVAMNIIFLVLVFPILMWLLLITAINKSFNLYNQKPKDK